MNIQETIRKVLREESRLKKTVDDYEYNAQRAERQKKIDEILDKISKSGYQTLSQEEKDFLFKNSK